MCVPVCEPNRSDPIKEELVGVSLPAVADKVNTRWFLRENPLF